MSSMASTSERTVYGLTEEESRELDSDDDEFFGEINENRRLADSESGSDLSEGEEIEEDGILDENELESRVLRVTGSTELSEEPSTSLGRSNDSTLSPDNDWRYNNANSKFACTQGCGCRA